MLRFLGGCVGRLLSTVLVVAVLAVAWYNRGEVVAIWDRLFGTERQVSEELAEQAAAKLDALGRSGVTRVVLHEPELQSLVQYRWAATLPPDLVAPRVGLGEGRVTVAGQVPTARLAGIRELQEILGFLPDTATLRAAGSFVPLDEEHVALEIHDLGAAGIPIPRRLIPAIVAHFRLEGMPEVGANALALPLPPGIGNVFVSGDSLIVSARQTGGA